MADNCDVFCRYGRVSSDPDPMPRTSSQQTIARQWTLLKRFNDARRGLTVRDLHQHLADAGFEVTKRTVERDLVELSAMFPLTATGSAPQLWKWSGSASAKGILSVDPVEGVGLVLAGEVLASILPGPVLKEIEWRFEAARRLLANLRDNRLAQWSQVIRYLPQGLQLRAPVVDPGVLESAQKALVSGRRLECRYRSANSRQTKAMNLHPLAIVLHGRTPYLLATIGAESAPFQYALHRFESAEVDTRKTDHPKDFDLDEYLERGNAGFGAGEMIRFEAEIRDTLPDILGETPLADDQRIIDRDGRRILKATVRESWELEFWILSQAHRLTVLKPVGLRRKIQGFLEQALAPYQSTP